MKNKLYIMSGIPGSGKTTFAKTYFPNVLYVSRDEIRFSLVSENEDYFSKEDDVYNLFIDKINKGLKEGKDVIADATHLNKYSRMKLLACLDIDPKETEIIVIFMRIPLKECISRNKKRQNTRSYVPISVIIKMNKSLKAPNFDECCGMINKIITVDENGHLTIIERSNI